MARLIKVGIIGCGGIANGKHMPSLKKVADCEMVAFCDIVLERAEEAKEKFGTPDAKVYTDYKELLKDPEIEVVHVCTPNRSHSFITVDALEAGKHVMCEKPMAINSIEAKKMLDAAKRTGKKLTIGYQSRFRDDSQYLKSEVESGTFGDIYYARAISLRRRAVPTWGVFLNEYEQGGGPLIDIGTHALDLTLWLMNNYKPKYCVGTTYHKLNNDTDQANMWGNWDPEKFTVEDSAFGFVVMENGATISLETSWALNTLDVREAVTQFSGTKAGADMVDGVRINGVRNGRQYVLQPSFTAGGVAFNGGEKGESMANREARLWIEAIREDKDPITLPEQAYVITRILEGIYTSAKTGDIYRFTEE
ncbi:MAG: Gfo/Idh/MocA family oxidoreductase [Ruminococcaceae bacterium]|nr:Gfo/Idh/MocA family oxidoreductase [Oscillospiraceae bacterium]